MCGCSWSRTTRGWRPRSAAGCASRGWSSTSPAAARRRCGMAGATEYDAIVLDVMLPGLDGFETCRRLRADGVWAPVLMLTARDAVEDRVRGPRRRRRRLPDQAVLAGRAARAAAGAGRGAARSSARRCSRSATCGSTRPRARCWRGEPRSRSRRASSRCWRRSCAGPARCSRSCSCSRPRGTSATSSARTWSRSTCATCARRSTGRSACESIETVRGVGYRLRNETAGA